MLKNNGALHTLAGFENSEESGLGVCWNFILSNGTRSSQRDKIRPTKYDHFIPSDALNKIRSVDIHYYYTDCITGFSFFDKDGALLWEIGETSSYNVETVEIAESERIIGVVAKLYLGWQSRYTDFAFQIALE